MTGWAITARSDTKEGVLALCWVCCGNIARRLGTVNKISDNLFEL